MINMIIFDTNKNPSEDFYQKLSQKNKEIVDRFEANCRINANPKRSAKAKANAVRFLTMVNKDIEDIGVQDLKNFLGKLKEAKFSDYYNNDVKNFIHRFLKELFKDWSQRFNDFEDIKYDSDPMRKKKIGSEDILSKGDVEKLIKAEPELFWKTFLIVQYEGALRTGETRTLKWENIDVKDGEVYWLNITSKKNRRSKDKERVAPPLSQSVYFLDELRKLQSERKMKSTFVFNSSRDLNSPISCGAVNKWFSRLTKKVLGKASTNYILRHSKGEEFHVLVRDNKMSKENAIEMMGHSEKMFDKTYSHPDKKLLKETLRRQVLNLDYVAPEKKLRLEEDIVILKKALMIVLRASNNEANLDDLKEASDLLNKVYAR